MLSRNSTECGCSQQRKLCEHWYTYKGTDYTPCQDLLDKLSVLKNFKNVGRFLDHFI